MKLPYVLLLSSFDVTVSKAEVYFCLENKIMYRMLCPIEDVVFMYCSSTCFTLRGESTFPFQPASSLHSLGACQDLNRLFWSSVACEGTGLHILRFVSLRKEQFPQHSP